MAQIVGSVSEVVLFFSGFFLGRSMFIIAAILVLFRIVSKISMSELMYNRMKAIFKEEGE